MSFTIGQLFVWVLIGIIAGTLASSLVTRTKVGFGLPTNMVLGMVGALVGGFLFKLLNLFPGLDAVSISLRDILSAIAGALIVLAAIWLKNRQT